METLADGLYSSTNTDNSHPGCYGYFGVENGEITGIGEDFISELVKLEYDNEVIEKFKKFIGSSIEVSHEGEMYNDGQILEWTITLSTKEGHDYTICNAHCAITGWTLRGEVEFN